MENKNIDMVAMSAKPFLVLLGFAWFGMASAAVATGYAIREGIKFLRKKAAEENEESGD